MYRAIVRRKARGAFALLNAGQLDEFMAGFADDAVFEVAGEHALGGEAHGPAAVRAAFERLRHLFPDLEVTPTEMVVSGWPGNTVMANRIMVRATLPDGAPYRNGGMQYLRIRWGRVVEDRIYEDTATLVAALDRLAELGVS